MELLSCTCRLARTTALSTALVRARSAVLQGHGLAPTRLFSASTVVCIDNKRGDVSEWTLPEHGGGDASAAIEAVTHHQGDLASLGLGGYTPVGVVQNALELLHVHAHMPWWMAIVFTSAVLRFALLPLTIKMQQNSAKMFNVQPETAEIMENMERCKKSGDTVRLAQEGVRLSQLYERHGVNPFKMFVMPFIQMPIFLSFFMAIRKMAAIPVESMRTGGALWFSDLTIPDPTFTLPVIACASFLVNIEMGGEGRGSNPVYERTKKILRIGAIAILPITVNLPTGLFMYLLTTSFLTTGQIFLFKQPSVRTLLRIPLLIKHDVGRRN